LLNEFGFQGARGRITMSFTASSKIKQPTNLNFVQLAKTKVVVFLDKARAFKNQCGLRKLTFQSRFHLQKAWSSPVAETTLLLALMTLSRFMFWAASTKGPKTTSKSVMNPNC